MKRFELILLAALLTVLAVVPLAGAKTLLGPVNYERTERPPNIYVAEFYAPAGKAWLIVNNGGESRWHRVSKASLVLNGKQVLGADDLKKRFGIVKKEIAVLGNNTITVELDGRIGSYVSVQIIPHSSLAPENLSDSDFLASGMPALFGPEQYVRTFLPPNIYRAEFPARPGMARLIIKDGRRRGRFRLGEAQVMVNGEEVISLSDVTGRLAVLEVPIEVSANNTLSIDLKPKPEGYLLVQVIQPTVSLNVDDEAISPGLPVSLQWESTDVKTCVIEPGIGIVPASGSIMVSPDKNTTYVITGTDSQGLTTVASRQVLVNNKPIATPQTVSVGEDSSLSLILSGLDADGDQLTYQIVSSPASGTLTGEAPAMIYTPAANFNGADLLSYKVNDGQVDSEPAMINITVNPVNDLPVARSGSDREVYRGDVVTLDGSNSGDLDGDSLEYRWSIFSAPVESSATLFGSTLPDPSFVPDVGGVYQLQLIVNDGNMDSVPAFIAITALPRLVAVPNVVGSQQVEAEAAIAAASLIVGSVLTEYNDTVAAGQVIDQSPATGIAVEEGLPVGLVVSLGSAPPPEATVSLSSEIIQPGESATLLWTSANADSVTIDQGVGSVAINGSTVVTPAATTTYTVTAVGAGGTATASATATVLEQTTLPTANISASPTIVSAAGETTTLSWETTNVDSVILDYGERQTITLPLSGSMSLQVNRSTTYTIMATGSDGTVAASVKVWVGEPTPPAIVEFKAVLLNIIQGQNSYLKWSVPAASSVSIDPGIGPVAWSGMKLVAPSETTTYTITAIGSGGTATADVTVNVSSELAVNISAPGDKETMSDRDLTVSGIINTTINAETGVTVNGVPALVNGNFFTANNVPLQEGENIISVTAIDATGNASVAEITVWADIPDEYVRLVADRESGILPFEATVRVDASFGFSGQPSITYDGPGVLDIQPMEEDATFIVKTTTAGLYTLAVEVYDSVTKKNYTDTLSLFVFDKAALNNILQSKWNGIKERLISQDVEGALGNFLESSKEEYRQIFDSLADKLPQLVSDMQDIELIYVVDGTAKYRINRVHDLDGSPVTITYYIYFRVDNNDGLWKIDQF